MTRETSVARILIEVVKQETDAGVVLLHVVFKKGVFVCVCVVCVCRHAHELGLSH